MDLSQEWLDLLALIPGYDSVATASPTDYFDPAQAELALSFFAECLQFIEGERAGDPFELEPWQAAIVAALWGWRREGGTRRFRETLIYVPRKNGKSPFLAGLMLLSAYTDGEPGAQLYAAAASKEQASLIYRHAAGMVAAEPELKRRAKLYKSFKSIEFPDTNSIFKAVASNADNLHGLGANFVVVDELHAHANSDLVDVLVTSTAARRSPLVCYITTADFLRPSICNQKYEYACKVRDGVLADSSFLPVIYEATLDDPWDSPEVWAKANPNLGVSVKLEYLERECKRAKAEPSYEGTFRRLHLNQRTTTDVAWLRMSDWWACEGTVDPDALRGRRCFAALDLSTKIDLTAWVLVFPEDDGSYTVLPRFFMPAENLREREKRDKAPYQQWAQGGYIHLTDGNVIDHEAIKRQIVADLTTYQIEEVAFDPWSATQISLELAAEGATMTEVRQGFRSFSEPAKELEKLVRAGKLNHGNNPVLTYQASVTAIDEDAAGNIKPSKKKSTDRIDGIVALCMSLGRALVVDGPSVYETRGLLTL